MHGALARPRRSRLLGASGRGSWTSNHLATTAWALMANTVTTSALGVVFWGVASRLYSPSRLGASAALISAMILLSTVSQLNLGMGIPRLLPQVRDRRWRPVLGAYVLTAAVGVVVTATFVLLAPLTSDGFDFLGGDRILGLALVGAVVLWNIFALQDAVLTSARWAILVPIENGVFGLLKIGLMIWLARAATDHGVFLGWLLAMLLLLLPVNGLIFGRVLPSGKGSQPDGLVTSLPLAERGRIARYLAVDYVAALLSQGSTAVLPLLVIGVLGREANAYFYSAFLIAAAVGALAHSLSTSLVVEGAHDESELIALTRRSMARYATFVAPAVLVAILAAPVLLIPFGKAYVSEGTTLLRLLLAGTLPQALITLYLGVERVWARVRRVLAIEAATVLLVITGAIFGMHLYGLTGVGLAWVVAQMSVGGIVVPRLLAVIGGKGQASSDAPSGAEATSGIDATPVADPMPSAPFPSIPDFVNLGAAVVAAALLVVSGMGSTGTPRLVLALVFMTFVPGWVLLNHVRLADGTSRFALAVGLSLTLGSGVALSALWLRTWHPRGLLDVTAGLCLLGIAWPLIRGNRRTRSR